MVRPQWPYPAAREQTLSDESGGRSGAGEVAGEARAGQGASPQANAVTRTGPQNIAPAAPAESGRCILRKGEMQSENQSPVAAFCFLWSACRDPTGPTATATARSRFRPVDASRQTRSGVARDAMLKDIAAELGQHEVVGPGLLHRIISEVQRRYDVADSPAVVRGAV